MIVDSSALVAIALREPEAPALAVALSQPGPHRISAANLLEVWMVIDRRGVPEAAPVLRDTIRRAALLVEPVTAEHIAIARDAWRRFGRGSEHAAHLNFGDLFAYALAKHLGEPLLFVGSDFGETDIEPAILS